MLKPITNICLIGIDTAPPQNLANLQGPHWLVGQVGVKKTDRRPNTNDKPPKDKRIQIRSKANIDSKYELKI